MTLDREGEENVSDYDISPDHFLHNQAFTSREDALTLAESKAIKQEELKYGRVNPTETEVIEINSVEDLINTLLTRSNSYSL